MAGTIRQTRMQLRRQPKPNAPNTPAPPISTLLSQYELLASLCKHLSSADIIHLGATNREHWLCVASSPVILKGLIAESVCDGRGITAQARVFGYWKGNVTKATRKCRGEDARLCSDCGAMVCNACRFHIRYPDNVPQFRYNNALDGYPADIAMDFGQEDWDWHWDTSEEELSLDVRDGEVEAEEVTREIELSKAIDMLSTKDQTHCDDCEPLFVDNRLESKLTEDWCHCTLYAHFVEPWRCIPCVLAEQTKLITSQQKYKVVFDPNTKPEWMYEKLMFCACGKGEADRSTETCRWCGRVTGYCYDRDAHLLARIHAQFGTSVDGRAEDPILSQPG